MGSADAEADPYVYYGYGLGHLGYLDTSDTDTDTDTAMDTCTARGLLMLSLRLRPIPTFSTVDSDTPDTDWDTTSALLDISDTDTGSDTAPDTTTASRLHQDLSVNHLGQKWIVISLNFPSPVLQFQCYHTKSLVMVSRKQENQSGKNPTNI